MTSASDNQAPAASRLSSAPYILRPLISDVPLSADGDQATIRITCVEVLSMMWDLQLYDIDLTLHR